MDDQLSQPTNPTSNSPIIYIFVGIILLIAGFTLGFIIKPIINPQTTNEPQATNAPLSQKSTFNESQLPISLNILQNPLVYEWRGNVRGKLIAKDQNSLTLEDKTGNKLIITNKTASGSIFKTVFFKKSGSAWKEASSSAISVGNNLRGEFFIFKDGNNTPVGSAFWVEE